ncbi:MAG: hypothetical protein WCG55_02580 [bacterium]
MNRIILVIEDNPDQAKLAQVAVLSSGCFPVIAHNLADGVRLLQELKDQLVGVVTDMHYPSMNLNDRDADKPNGLSMVAQCVELNIPVSVCTDVDHHYCAYVEAPIKVLATHQKYQYGRIPFSLDHKDWKKSVAELLRLGCVFEQVSKIDSTKIVFVEEKHMLGPVEGYESISVVHGEAFDVISKVMPAYIVCLVESGVSAERWAQTERRYGDLKRSLLPGQKLIRFGFTKPKDLQEQHLQLPFTQDQLLALL